MRIAIVGAGAMGQLFGAKLLRDGNDVVLIDVIQKTVDSINSQGITIDNGATSYHAPATASLAKDVDEPAELIMVFTKGFDSVAAIESVRHLISEETVGLTLQNGLGNEQSLIDVFGAERTLMGATDFAAVRQGDTLIQSPEAGGVTLGDCVPRQDVSSHANAVAEIMDSAGLNAATHADVQIPIWKKLIVNTVLNTLGAATGITVGQTGSDPLAKRLAETVFEEAIAVAHAVGVTINQDEVRDTITTIIDDRGTHRTSMTSDIDSGRRTEIETIGGAVVAAGVKVGVPTPVLSVLTDVVRLRSGFSTK